MQRFYWDLCKGKGMCVHVYMCIYVYVSMCAHVYIVKISFICIYNDNIINCQVHGKLSI